MSASASLASRLRQDFRYALGRYFRLHKHRDEAAWARLLITSGFALFFPSFFISMAVVFGRARLEPLSVLFSYGMGFFIAFANHLVYRAFERLAPPPLLMRLNQGGFIAGLFFVGLPIVVMLASIWLYAGLVEWATQMRVVATPLNSGRALLQFLFIMLLFSLLGTYLAWAAEKRRRLQLQAVEAQLLRMQAQIEPHFLFNSLAAVQSLIEAEPARARRMLECFTDYLRASLQTMREDSCTLQQELDTVQSYLELMQIRMGEDRLRFAIEADVGARLARVPPLLLQPLVENAVQHGVEPQPDGGEIRLQASTAEPGWLVLQILDDGQGLDAPGPRQRPGNGLALKNIRERLAARYQGDASLLIEPRQPHGCQVRVRLPLVDMP